ncbi:hypothetical protein BDZ89DRAFT_954630 [Hymenopellis radicata]|nr:hypothetical protein BDZ89DRAFT_954630 [Hymenopellis radicata]
MATWRPYKDQFLSELLRRDGLGDDTEICARCTSESPGQAEYRCCDEQCVGLGLVCRKCCLEFHETHPLHCIEKWNGFYFDPTSLRELGLTVQLGHPAGMRCPFPHSTTREFTVLAVNGIHSVCVLFCGCSTAPPAYVQLLRRAWYPATPLEPRSATTFGLLRLFHTINTLGKLPAWDMWQALKTMTENRSGTPPVNRYKVLLRAIRQWRFLKLLKRAGRGHDPSGADGTAPGELALRCPACPHPGINLPENWRRQPRQYRFRLFTAQDANFRARNAIVSTPERDPPLGDGLTHFTTQAPYEAHIRAFVNQEDMSSCSGFQAMFLANLKNVRGLRTTGVAGVTCARHGVWMPNGIGDLQRGERYCNVDPLIASVLKANENHEIVISYDIACQWGSGFWERVASLPEQWRPSMEREQVTFCIPKFHLWAHKVECHALYSFNYLVGAGRTHSETVEANWADSNRAAAQTKMMGPGSRHDTLDDIFAAHNYQTIMAFGK